MKKILLIICFTIPLFAFTQSNMHNYKFKVISINTEAELKQNKVTLQELIGISDDMNFSNGFIFINTKENYSTVELKLKLNSNNFSIVGDIYKDIKTEQLTE